MKATNVNLTIDNQVWLLFRKMCQERDVSASKMVEEFMRAEIRKDKDVH